MNSNTWSMEVVQIDGPESLRECTPDSDVDVVQLKRQKLQGSLTHICTGNLGITVGQFNSGIRARGPLNRDSERVLLGTLLANAGRMSEWWHDLQLGDITVHPAYSESDSIFTGAAAYVAVSVASSELTSILQSEGRLADPALWQKRAVHYTDPDIREVMPRRLRGIFSALKHKTTAPTAQAVDFLRRSVIEAFVLSLINGLPTDRGRFHYTGARLVREAEDYVDAAAGRPVHVSELCSALKVSRRSLHRAFAETLGMGPVSYLRRRRLSAIRSVLSRADPEMLCIADVAFEYGFPEPGRFAAYYRAHFGESPSQTLRSASPGLFSSR